MDAATGDLYAVLGVARGAPAREIRRAYRRLARQHHPDLNGQGPEQFARLAHAYEVLHDPVQRARYDRTLPRPVTVVRPADTTHRPAAPARAALRRGILELSSAEALHVAHYPLALHDAEGHTILVPAGTGHGDQITVADGTNMAILTVRTHIRT